MLNKIESINLSDCFVRPDTVRIKTSISKNKSRRAQKKQLSIRRLKVVQERMHNKAHAYFPTKKVKQLKLSDLQKKRRE